MSEIVKRNERGSLIIVSGPSGSGKTTLLNVIGGLKIEERTSDLLIVLLLASSLKNKPLQEGMVSIGEVSLTGEVRNVSNLDKRISECKKLGFTKMIIPRNNYDAVKDTKGIEIWPVDNLRQAINIVVGGNR